MDGGAWVVSGGAAWDLRCRGLVGVPSSYVRGLRRFQEDGVARDAQPHGMFEELREGCCGWGNCPPDQERELSRAGPETLT
jgi:hypothetical protein